MTTYNITNTDDSGPGSLRDIIETINGTLNVFSVIDFSSSGTIMLESPLPQITRSFSLNGNRELTIDGNYQYNILSISTSSGNAEISNIRFINGFANESCAGITALNTSLQLININIGNCVTQYSTTTTYGTIIYCENGTLSIYNNFPGYGNINGNNNNFTTSMVNGLIRTVNSDVSISGGLIITGNYLYNIGALTDKIDGTIISMVGGTLQMVDTTISYNFPNGDEMIIGSLIYYDSNTNMVLDNITFDSNGNEGNTVLENCIYFNNSTLLTLTLNNITATNMRAKFIYGPLVELLFFENVRITNMKSIAIIDSMVVNNPITHIFNNISDDNINGCLGFEIRSINVIQFNSLTLENFTSSSPNSIASCFYFPNAQGGAPSFYNCTFRNISAEGQVIKFINPNLSATIIVENCSFSNCTSRSNGTTISFDNTQSTLQIGGCYFNECSTFGNGGALLITNGCELDSTLTTSPTTFYLCSATNGGAILFEQNSITQNLNLLIFNTCSSNNMGGAIYTETLINSRNLEYRNCSATNGGAIYYNTTNEQAQTIISTSPSPTFINNTASNNGGAIFLSNTAILSIGESLNPFLIQFINNTASNSGGAIYIDNSSQIIQFSASCQQNTAQVDGGALYFNSTVSMTFDDNRVELMSNTAINSGGNIYIGPTSNVTLNNLILYESNSSRGGNIFNAGFLTMDNTTLTDNVSASCLETETGSITSINMCTLNSTTNTMVLNGRLSMIMSSVTSPVNGIVSYDTCEIYQCLIYNCTLGLNIFGQLLITNSTISNCTYCIAYASTQESNVMSSTIIGETGIICDTNANKIIVVNSIISNVSAPNTSQIQSNGNNLITDNSGITYFTQPTDLNNVNPLLGPLQDNGGPTLSYMLLNGSPAINAGNTSYASTYDQRGPGYPRVVNEQMDIGSIESEDLPICFTNDSQIQITTNPSNTNVNVNIIDLINSNPKSIYTIHGANKIEVTKIISTIAPKTLIQINENTNPTQFNPSHPTHFTDGHILIQNDGQHIKAKNVQNKTTIQNTNYTNVYSLITPITATLKVNNINTLTLSESKYDSLIAKGSKAVIVWSNKNNN